MKIASVETYLMQAGSPAETAWAAESGGGMSIGGTRQWLFVRIIAEDGTYGVGEGSGWPIAVEVAVRDLAPLLVGQEVFNIDRLWSRLHLAQMGHGLTGTVGGGALSALDMALWDLNGKLLGVPVWRLLGGKFRDVVPAYAHTSSVETTKRLIDLGYRAFKTGGVSTALDKAVALRATFGNKIDLMVDLHGPPWLTPADARRMSREFEPLNLLFLEEPVAPEHPSELLRLRDACHVPVAAGERTAKIWGLAPLITSGSIDVAQPDTGRFGGISQMKKLAAIAEAFGVTIAPHAGTLGPVAEFAAIHLMAAIPNALILERFGSDWPGRERVISAPPVFRDGGLEVPDAPGLGVDLMLDEIAKYPAQRNTGIPNDAHYAPGTTNEHLYIQPRFNATGLRARTAE